LSDVKLEGLSKRFGDMTAVDDISLVVGSGEFFSLLGPSGCGKTTTLRMIGGFEDPSEGTISLGGEDVTHLPPNRRNVNTVFQSYALFPHLNVHENVAFGLKRMKVPGDEITKRVTDMLDLVSLSGYGERRTTQLSGGQQQRVALARALVNRPEVLLLDEPLGALDLKLRKQMQLELKRIQTEVGITFIYVTHDQDEAMTMSDRIAVMNKGRLEQLGLPEEVYETPATGFVASFLGASNLLPGRVEDASGDPAKVALDAGVVITLPRERLPKTSGGVQIGVRPEKLSVGGDAQGTNVIDATVMTSTYTGVATAYGCKTSDGSHIDVYVQNLGATQSRVAAGERVRLSWRPEHTFAVETARADGEVDG
jgi:spermidine/putrescine transport system ATP-binding protein